MDKKNIGLEELQAGGPPKDGIPSIDNPDFITPEEANNWLEDQEPVIALEIEGEARAYPLQILIWHEIVNDEIQGKPVAVTFCPLCYSAIVFDRTVKEDVLEFGVSGFLRHSDMVMFDRKTESLWQQFNGRGIVGDYTGTELEQVSSQLISFGQFKKNYPGGEVLSRNTGHDRRYGSNPYTGYDDIDKSPLLFDGEEDGRLPPMEKVVGVRIDDQTKAYPHSVTREKQVINDQFANVPLLIIHTEGATSALDRGRIAQSREDGSTGAFNRTLDGEELTFSVEDERIIDEQTGSVWTIAGKAVDGPHKGKELKSVTFGDYFAFAWLVFWPETEIYSLE